MSWNFYKGRLASVPDSQASELPQGLGKQSDMLTAMRWPKGPACGAGLLGQTVFSKQPGWPVRPRATLGSSRLSVTGLRAV